MSNIDPNIIKARRSNSVPLPPSYRTDLPDQAPENHDVYVDFHNQIGRLMADDHLTIYEKMAMVAYFLYGTEASAEKIMRVSGIHSLELLHEVRCRLMYYDWLASPAG